jgi:hypothetical protein
MPGPSEKVSLETRGKSVTASIKFKTSGTLLRNLLPNKSYSFAAEDTVAIASLMIESYRNGEWMGFNEFNRVSLEIHGINYTKPDNTVISGRYVPVAFENSADSISAARETLGYPSVFSDIDLQGTCEGSFYANLSWRGVQWAKVWLKDLATTPIPLHEPSPEGVLVHQHIPAITDGSLGSEKAVEQDILIVEEPSISKDGRVVNGDGNSTAKDMRTLSSKSSSQAGFEFAHRSRSELPTLHHIVARLSELPIFEVLGATVREGEGPEKDMKASKISR